MKKLISLTLAIVLLKGIFGITLMPLNISAQTQEVLTNEMVIEMVKTGISDQIIIAKIKSSKNSFDTSTNSIQTLKIVGVSDSVILEMVQYASNKTDNNASIKTSDQSGGANTFVIPDGTPVKLRISRNLSSADAKTGETVDFEVLEDVKLNDILIIPRGGVALGTVTRAKPKGRMGKGGKLDITIDSVRLISGDKIALRAVKESKGNSHTGAMTGAIVASSILFFPAAPFFLFMKGKDITIPKGTEVSAYTNGEIILSKDKFKVTSN